MGDTDFTEEASIYPWEMVRDEELVRAKEDNLEIILYCYTHKFKGHIVLLTPSVLKIKYTTTDNRKCSATIPINQITQLVVIEEDLEARKYE